MQAHGLVAEAGDHAEASDRGFPDFPRTRGESHVASIDAVPRQCLVTVISSTSCETARDPSVRV